MNTDDPKLTAFALGELDETERREIEALLRGDPAAAAEVAQLREFSLKVRTVLAGETAPALGPIQRAELLATARGENAEDAVPENEKPARSLRRRPVWIPSAIAASVMILGWYAFLHQPLDRFSPMRTADFEPTGGGSQLAVDSDRPLPAEPQPNSPAAVNSPAPKLSPGPSVANATSELTPLRSLSQTKDESSVSFKLQPPAPPAAPAMDAGAIQYEGGLFAAKGESLAASGTGRLRTSDGSSTYSGGTRDDAAKPHFAMPAAAAPLPAPARGQKEELAENPSTRRPGGSPAIDAMAEQSPASKQRLENQSYFSKNSPVPPVAATPAALAPAPYTERINIVGNARTKDKVVRREIALQPGDVLKQKRMADAAPSASTAAPSSAPAEYEPPQIAQNFGGTIEDAGKAAPYSPRGIVFPADIRQPSEPGNTEAYDTITDNPFLTAKENPLSTFSIDVDTASYANVRRFLNTGHLPPKGAVRIEELVNYFHYDYPQPKAGEPFSVNMEVAGCPWTPEHRLLRIGLKGREIPKEQRPPANLVFLIDVSGSMMPENRLPLVKESLRLLVDQLSEKDTVAIAVYAGASGTVLEPTHDKAAIREALGRLQAGGSTNGGAGIKLAYELARRSFDKEKTNRVILATDGDFNVGVTNQSELVDLITKEAKSGVFLTVLGVGYGNLKDSTMEKLADKGNGNYAYIDTLAEGRKVLVEQMAGTLITIAKDVKIQIEFNPRQVSGYRLIGYENRLLAKEDFNNDKKDAGEIGAGHTVTALYEIVPVNLKTPSLTAVDPLKYQPKAAAKPATPLDTANERTFTGTTTSAGETRITTDHEALAATKEAAIQNELLTLKLRWKAPDADTSTLREIPLTDEGLTYEKSSQDFRWAAAVTGFGMILRDSQYKGAATWNSIKELAEEGRGEDPAGYRAEFIQLLDKASALKR